MLKFLTRKRYGLLHIVGFAASFWLALNAALAMGAVALIITLVICELAEVWHEHTQFDRDMRSYQERHGCDTYDNRHRVEVLKRAKLWPVDQA